MGKCVKTNTDFEECRFLWCSSIAVFFGHAIDSVECLFCLFLPWLFSPFFLSVGSFPQASGSSARHVFLVLYYMRNFFNLIG